jgi:hypothetical protein
MSLHYATIGYTAAPDPDVTLKVPVGGNYALRLPRTEEIDPWDMHPHRLADGTVIGPWPNDPQTALIVPAVTGLAHIAVDATWQGTWNDGVVRRAYVVGDNFPYELGYETDGPEMAWTTMTFVKAGDPFVIMFGHTAATPQTLLSARVNIAINDDVADPPTNRLHVRRGTDPGQNPEPRQ